MLSFNNLCLFFFIFLLPIFGVSQNTRVRISKKLVSIIQEAEAALLNNRFDKAEALYLSALKKKSDYVVAKRGLSIVCQAKNNYQASAEMLQEIVSDQPYFSRVIYAEMAHAFFRAGQYDLAEQYFNEFAEIIKLPIAEFGINGEKEFEREGIYAAQLSKHIEACQIAKEKPFAKYLLSIKNLGDPINSSLDEYFPFLMNGGKQLYFTRKEFDENLYLTTKKNTNWSIPVSLDAIFNTNKNEGMASFTRDGRQIYFTACQRSNVQGTCDIQNGFLKNEKIIATQPLKGGLNSDRWESQACVSCDGRTIFFASNRLGGYGSTDLYWSQLQEDQTWSEPQNLGPNINSKMDEEAPFITDDGLTLFFSSTGHLGLGEQDIYMSQLQENGQWGAAINLGAPINTGYREIGFFLAGDGKTGYFSSDRPNGKGKMDIYQFDLKEGLPNKSLTYLEGFVKDSITKLPIQTVLYTEDNVPIFTDSTGRFFQCLFTEEVFNFKVTQKKYHPYTFSKIILKQENTNHYHLDVLLSPIKNDLTENTIEKILPKKTTLYFEFDSDQLTASAQTILTAFIKEIKDLPIDHIQIIGYTDSSGSIKYNDLLSRKRATSVANFLKQSEGWNVKNKILEIMIEGRGVLQSSVVSHEKRKVAIEVVFK